MVIASGWAMPSSTDSSSGELPSAASMANVNSSAVTRAVGPTEAEAAYRLERDVGQLFGLFEYMDEQLRPDAAVIAGIGDGEIAAAVDFIAGHVFPVDVAHALDLDCRTGLGLRVDGDQLGGVVAVVHGPEDAVMAVGARHAGQ